MWASPAACETAGVYGNVNCAPAPEFMTEPYSHAQPKALEANRLLLFPMQLQDEEGHVFKRRPTCSGADWKNFVDMGG